MKEEEVYEDKIYFFNRNFGKTIFQRSILKNSERRLGNESGGSKNTACRG
ncbi:MAG: hypothetical protein SVY10_10080 [Thermodesulfobacteriota bacterium]|nr:hypothetical protein [Thermodesulfobacteriota bacterium]